MTLIHALIKSFTNFSSASSDVYTSVKALNSELEPKIRSTAVAYHFSLPIIVN